MTKVIADDTYISLVYFIVLVPYVHTKLNSQMVQCQISIYNHLNEMIKIKRTFIHVNQFDSNFNKNHIITYLCQLWTNILNISKIIPDT